MKRITATALLAVSLLMGAHGQSLPKSAAACHLMERMAGLQKSGIMFGHQDDPVYGTSWKWETGRSDVLEVCGDYPAVMGFDLGKLELGSDENLDGVPFDRMRREIIAQSQRGGIVTLSWHPWNPSTGENAWDPSGHAVTAILPDGALTVKFAGWLAKVAGFINSLRTGDGQKVPVIFRPWHEMSGAWFWWGSKSCTPEEYRQLYRYTRQTLEKAGCDNIIWAYSPNLSDGAQTEANFMKFYPGDDYVDLLGTDVYQFSADNSVYQANLRKELDVLKVVGEKHHKLIALTETGYQNVPDPTWFTQCLLPVIKDYPICYVLLWRNAWDNPKENYVAAPGKPTVNDFRKFYQDKLTLFVKDIRKNK